MKTTIDINGKPVEIVLTKEQVEVIKKASADPMDCETWEAICSAGNIDPVKSLPFPSPVTKKQVSANGLFKLETIFDAYNHREEFTSSVHSAWEPDYTNGSQWKYYPWHEWVASRSAFVSTGTNFTFTSSSLGSRLCTDTDAKAIRIAKTFNAEWNEFLNPKI
jgi:hypothetical protein